MELSKTYYQALFKIEGVIRKVGAIFTDRQECEERAKALVNSTHNWYYIVVEQNVIE